jgi:hypothetical protein
MNRSSMIKNALYVIAVSIFIQLLGCAPSKQGLVHGMPIAKKGTNDSFLVHLLGQYPQYFDTLLKNNRQWNIQVVYSRIDRTKSNTPRFTHFFFNTDSAGYFYPASTVKLPAAVLALHKLNTLHRPGLHKYTTMITEAGRPLQTAVCNDPTAEDGRPTIAHYIKKILLVSDNDAFNRLYEFLGQEYLNKTLHKMGYSSVQIRHRLSVALPDAENRFTNPISFYDSTGAVVYRQPAAESHLLYPVRSDYRGTGFYQNDTLITQPFNFSTKNQLSLPDLHGMLLQIMFPKAVPKKHRFYLTRDDYRFLYQYMSMAPRQSRYPMYDSTYNDAYVKFLFYGATDPVNPDIRIFNKVGDAYGFLTDAAYIIDVKNGIEFLLSATIHCNSDGIYNDDKYDYDSVGFPFMKNLGRVVYEYERTRTRRHAPDFSRFLK